LFSSSVSTNCTGISTVLVKRKPMRTLMYIGSPSRFTNTSSALPIFWPTPLPLTPRRLYEAACLLLSRALPYSFRAGRVEESSVEPKRAELTARFGYSYCPLVNALRPRTLRRFTMRTQSSWRARR
jgi:hypothetical protein